MVSETQQKKAALVAELQALGVENVNPNAGIPALEKMVKEAKERSSNKSGESETTSPENSSDMPAAKTISDTDRILMAIGGLASRVEGIEGKVRRMEDKGVNDFKMDMKEEDVIKAAENKSSVDPRIVRIVEETLGVDFGIEMEGFSDKPGVMLHILVPKRLSMVPTAFRPVRDPESGKYKVDPKTQEVVEEEYWPGDKRSLSMGVASSYEMVQQHCNRVRSFIISWYQKMNKPIPTFNLK